MVNRYKILRINREDFDKMVRKKNIIERDVKELTGKPIKIKDIQLFKLAANSTWDLGKDYQNKIIRVVKFKRGRLKI